MHMHVYVPLRAVQLFFSLKLAVCLEWLNFRCLAVYIHVFLFLECSLLVLFMEVVCLFGVSFIKGSTIFIFNVHVHTVRTHTCTCTVLSTKRGDMDFCTLWTLCQS